MKRIHIFFCALILLSSLTACSSTQPAAPAPAATSAAVQETAAVSREIVYYDSYYSEFPHFPVPESFVDVSIGSTGYADVERAFEYFPGEEDAVIDDLIKDYCISLMDLGFSLRQEADGLLYLYSGDVLVGVIEPSDSSFYVYCVVSVQQETDYEAAVITLNKTAVSAFAEVTPIAVGAGKQVSASDELFETTVTSRNDGNCLIWIEADLFNKTDTRVELQYNYYVAFLQDGFVPQEAKLVASPVLPVKGEQTLVWYAEVPLSYVANCQSLAVRIGFMDQFENIDQKQLTDERSLLFDVVLTEDQLASLKQMIAA